MFCLFNDRPRELFIDFDAEIYRMRLNVSAERENDVICCW